jgi:hypothetical protein
MRVLLLPMDSVMRCAGSGCCRCFDHQSIGYDSPRWGGCCFGWICTHQQCSNAVEVAAAALSDALPGNDFAGLLRRAVLCCAVLCCVGGHLVVAVSWEALLFVPVETFFKSVWGTACETGATFLFNTRCCTLLRRVCLLSFHATASISLVLLSGAICIGSCDPALHKAVVLVPCCCVSRASTAALGHDLQQ